MTETGWLPWFEHALHAVSTVFEAMGVLVMALGLLLALAGTLGRILAHGTSADLYHPFRTTLARSILLGLEFLVAADIIGTVAVEPTIENLLALALIVVIRTVLSFSLQIEISGRLPWRSPTESPEAE